jgi:hypothetical protein
MDVMVRKVMSIIVLSLFWSLGWGANAPQGSSGKGPAPGQTKSLSSGAVQNKPNYEEELNEALVGRLERSTNNQKDLESLVAFQYLLRKRMALVEKKAPNKEITDVDVEILKTILAVDPKRRDGIFSALEQTWDGKDDYFKVFISIFTQLKNYREYFPLEYGQLKAWEIYLKGQHRKVLDQRERQNEKARLKAGLTMQERITTPTATKSIPQNQE